MIPLPMQQAMRRKRLAIAGLAAIAAAVGFAVYRWQWPLISRVGIYALLTGLYVLMKRQIRCPSCAGPLSSLLDKVCPRCGIPLDESEAVRATRNPSDPAADEAALGIARAVEAWHRIQRVLNRLIFVPAVLVAAWLGFGGGSADAGWGTRIGIPLFAGVMAWLAGWMLLLRLPNLLFWLVLWISRGRCPACRRQFRIAWGSSPDSVEMDLVFPDFCPNCAVRLRP